MTPLPALARARTMLRAFHLVALILAGALPLGVARAQEASTPPAETEMTPEQAAQARKTLEHLYERQLKELGATPGPVDAPIGTVAHMPIREGMHALGPAGTQRWLEKNENFAGPQHVAAVLADERTGAGWVIIFTYIDEGYIEDDEKDELDADDLLDSLRERQDEANEMRKERGWGTLEVVGWEKPPFYDERTHNLTWATRIRGDDGYESINWTTRLLGRRGHMKVDLVMDPAQRDTAVATFDELLAGFEYRDGERYAQFVDGDHVAEYGLGALVVGGAGVAAAKMGLFAKLGKFLAAGWKVILIALVALGAVFKKLGSKLFGRDPKLDAGRPGSAPRG